MRGLSGDGEESADPNSTAGPDDIRLEEITPTHNDATNDND